MSQTLWIARHGNRQDFVDPFWSRTAEYPYDPALSSDGQIQAQELAQRLARESIQHIFASPFLRTIQTAHPIAERLNLPIKLEFGLGEHLSPKMFQALPTLIGNRLSPEQLQAQFPRVEWTSPNQVIPTFPETHRDAVHRSGQAAKLITQNCKGNVLIVGHGVSMLGASWGLLGRRPRIRCSLCGLVQLVQHDQRWTLALRGETSHLSCPSSRLSSYVQYWLRRKHRAKEAQIPLK